MKTSEIHTSANSKIADAPANSIKSTLVHEFQSFVADVEDLIKETTHVTGDDLARVKKELQQRINSARDSANEIGHGIANRAQQSVESTNNYVHEKPWNAIGASAAVGLILGYLFARTTKSA